MIWPAFALLLLSAPCDPAGGQFYSQLNREYFGNKLEAACIQYQDHYMEAGYYASTEKADNGGYLIVLDSRFRELPSYGKLAIEHEACHIDTWDDTALVDKQQHGPPWKHCMRRLALEGAMDDLW